MPVITFLQEFKSACNSCSIHKSDTIWLFKQLLTGPAEAGVEACVISTISINVYHEVALKSYSSIVQFLLKRIVTDDNVAKLNTQVHNLRPRSMIRQNMRKNCGEEH